MNKELTKKLIDRFSFYRVGKDVTEHFYFGFQCADGWFNLLWELSLKLEVLKFNGYVNQVKEKFGGLRFYVSSATDEQYDLINKYEAKSYKTCENCGKRGKIRNNNGWLSVLCKQCWKKEN